MCVRKRELRAGRTRRSVTDGGSPFQRGGGRRESYEGEQWLSVSEGRGKERERVTTTDGGSPFQRGRRERVSTDRGGDNI